MTYLGDASGELSLDQLRYHGLLPANPTHKENNNMTPRTAKKPAAAPEKAGHADTRSDEYCANTCDHEDCATYKHGYHEGAQDTYDKIRDVLNGTLNQFGQDARLLTGFR